MSDYFDDAFFSKFCDESVVNQYLKMVAYSAHSFSGVNEIAKLKRESEKYKLLLASLEVDLNEERSKVADLKMILFDAEKWLSEECFLENGRAFYE